MLAGLTDYEPTAPRLSVNAGTLGVRAFPVSTRSVKMVLEDGLKGDDQYVVQLWPGAKPESVRVLKAYG